MRTPADAAISPAEKGQTCRSIMARTGTKTIAVTGCILIFCKSRSWARVA